jgi:hypothetical protein
MDEEFWHMISLITGRLDDGSVLPAGEERLARIMKLGEEQGEVIQAVLGAIGQNPRKGVTNGWNEVSAELVDVILTAAVALYTVEGGNASDVFAGHVARVAERTMQLPARSTLE